MAMKHFFVGVKAVIRDGDKVLLAHGHKDGDRAFWDTPGGRIDDDESIPETLARELREEVPGLRAYEVGRLLHAERVHKDIVGDVSLTLLFYEVTEPVFEGGLDPSEEHAELKWFTLDEALKVGVPSIQTALKTLTK